jgi:hypothetical protein
MARPLDRNRQPTLMPSARTGLAPRLDLTALGDETPQFAGVFVVDLVNLIDAERADLSARSEASAPSSASAATTTAATWTAAESA